MTTRTTLWLRSVVSDWLMYVVAVDLLFVVLHVLYKIDAVTDSRFDLASDRGYSELFQYAKLGGIVLLLGRAYLASLLQSRRSSGHREAAAPIP